MKEMTINERIKELRIENGLTQKQLAEAVGIPQTTVACHEIALWEPAAVFLLR